MHYHVLYAYCVSFICNRLTADAVNVLGQNLRDCLTLISLNLNYCHMTPECGEPLGLLTSASQIRHLGIQGNTLQSSGVQALLSCLAVVAETSESMPLLGKLYLQDNEIDGCGRGGVFAPVLCMQILGRYMCTCCNYATFNLYLKVAGKEQEH